MIRVNDQSEVKTHVPSVMEDPSATSVAKVYSKAFLGSIAESDRDSVLEELSEVLDIAMTQQPVFGKMLMSNSLSKDERLSLVDRVFAPHASELLTNFLRVLSRHERLDLLPLIFNQIKILRDTEAGRKAVTVRSAYELNEKTLTSIEKCLNEALRFSPVIETSIDQSVIGGLVIQVDDTVYDGSLRTRLKQLRGRLNNRSIHEIQSGRNRFSNPEGN